MAKMVEKRRVHCPIRHIGAFIIKYDDGSYSVKCGLLKACGDSCPYLKNPDYRSLYRKAPEYKP
ncbi:unnamed protein product [marine sediment metagenome]|uniref:Uncharacterized protein n=1 Tax=marine sediment metagenome TaxID=412755 RepID=X1Q1C6_9ZZZZ